MKKVNKPGFEIIREARILAGNPKADDFIRKIGRCKSAYYSVIRARREGIRMRVLHEWLYALDSSTELYVILDGKEYSYNFTHRRNFAHGDWGDFLYDLIETYGYGPVDVSKALGMHNTQIRGVLNRSSCELTTFIKILGVISKKIEIIYETSNGQIVAYRNYGRKRR